MPPTPHDRKTTPAPTSRAPGRARATARLAAGVFAMALVASGCGPALVAPAGAAELESFGTCEALLTRIHEVVRSHVGAYGFDDRPVAPGGVAADPDVAPRPAAPGRMDSEAADLGAPADPAGTSAGSATQSGVASGSAQAASGTNVQEAGIDEDDTVKAGPGRILVLTDEVLRFVDVADGSPRLRGETTFGFDAETLLVEGDRVLVLGSEPHPDDGRPQVVVAEVDVTDPDNLRRGSSVRIDGELTAARSHEGVARLVVDSRPDLAFVAPGPTRRGTDTAVAANRDIVESSTLSDWLPRPDGAPMPDCAKVMVPRSYAGAGMLTVTTLDLNGPLRVVDETALLARGETVYDSGATLYVAMASFDPDAARATTNLHAFDTSGPDAATYLASGRVAGTVPGRWALSESAGVLRVVTADDAPAATAGASLRTLRREGTALVEAARVDGLGRGEQVKAVRFVGDVGYVVTFKRTDPLWVLDLRDPAHPNVAAELHVPGYSAYLHPLGDGTLVGVGQDADEATGRPLGLKVEIFDVSDPARPRSGAQWHAEAGSSSPAEDDPHAFLWWAPTGTIALPVVEATTAGAEPWNGGPLPTVGPAGPDVAAPTPPTVPPRPHDSRGPSTVVLHAGSGTVDAVGSVSCPGSEATPYAPGGAPGGDVWRSAVVGDSLFAVCSGGVAGYRLDGLSPTGQVRWH